MLIRWKPAALSAVVLFASAALVFVGTRTVADETAEKSSSLPFVRISMASGKENIYLSQPTVEEIGRHQFLSGQEFTAAGELIPNGVRRMVSIEQIDSLRVYKSPDHYKLVRNAEAEEMTKRAQAQRELLRARGGFGADPRGGGFGTEGFGVDRGEDPSATAKQYFKLLDGDSNDTISEAEWTRSARVRRMFELGKIDMSKPMTEAEFVEHYVRLLGK
ncbi:MAG: hypothetical protein IT428_32245 [Planctomycetaceae bacterium]|nr:hypothetical protein [Planctomycetaceae bacterium]